MLAFCTRAQAPGIKYLDIIWYSQNWGGVLFLGVLLAGMIVYCVCKIAYSSVNYEELPPTAWHFYGPGSGSGSTSDMFPLQDAQRFPGSMH